VVVLFCFCFQESRSFVVSCESCPCLCVHFTPGAPSGGGGGSAPPPCSSAAVVEAELGLQELGLGG
jgi:hypothetical protein